MAKKMLVLALCAALAAVTVGADSCDTGSGLGGGHEHARKHHKRHKRKHHHRPVAAPPSAPAPEPQSNCDASYGGCLDPNASDYDCVGGSGDGPRYTGPVPVKGDDHFDLDRDGDGVGCDE